MTRAALAAVALLTLSACGKPPDPCVYYAFDPQPDITAYLLALVVVNAGPGSLKRICFLGVDVPEVLAPHFRKLPAEAPR